MFAVSLPMRVGVEHNFVAFLRDQCSPSILNVECYFMFTVSPLRVGVGVPYVADGLSHYIQYVRAGVRTPGGFFSCVPSLKSARASVGNLEKYIL